MDIVGGAKRVITRTADITTAAAGALGGAAVVGAIGGSRARFREFAMGLVAVAIRLLRPRLQSARSAPRAWSSGRCC
jgi:hypothetical protein